MKLPFTVDLNILNVYKRSSGEECRANIISDNFDWDGCHPEKLSNLCVRKIAEFWGDNPVSEFPLAKDRNFLLEILDTRLPLPLLAERITDDAFWKRAYQERWPKRHEGGRPFVQMYMEAHCSEELENMHPKSYDPEKISELVRMCAPHVRYLAIRSMVPSELQEQNDRSSSLEWLHNEEDLTKTAAEYFKNKANSRYRDHIPLSGIVSSLILLTELHITFGLRSAGALYRRDMFQFTPTDLKHLSRGLEKTALLKILRITRSDLDCGKLKTILRALTDNHYIKTLDFSHCKIGDIGALTLAKYSLKHPGCKEIILVNNQISTRGAEGFGYALSHPTGRLLTLDLRMNTLLGSAGAAFIASALLRGSVLQNLNVSGCGITMARVDDAPDCGQLFAAAIAARKTPLRDVDLSVNELGVAAGAALAGALESCGPGGGPAKLGVRSARCGKWEAHIARLTLRNAARRQLAARRFKSGAARLLAAARVARGFGIIEADPLQLARHLTARPSAVSAASLLSLDSFALPDLGDLESLSFSVPTLKNPLPSSPESSVTEVLTSRRSSYHGSTSRMPPLANEVRRSALVRRSSIDGTKLQGTRSADSQRRIKIFVSNTNIGAHGNNISD